LIAIVPSPTAATTIHVDVIVGARGDTRRSQR
jgi:hypothetical protein